MRVTFRAFMHLVAGAGCAAVGTAACADALKLTTGTGGGTTSTTTTTTGTGGPQCGSALDCTSPTPVCDPVGKVCVECDGDGDCAEGAVCSKGKCGCAPADGGPALTLCAGSTPTCVDITSSPTDCGSCGHACFGDCSAGACVDVWEPLPTDGAPDGRSNHVAAWTGTQMFVWGGMTGEGLTNTGGLYDPVARTWTATSVVNAPSPRQDATAVVGTNNVVLVWGGMGDAGPLGDGAAYDPSTNTWTAISMTGTPPAPEPSTPPCGPP